MKGPVPAWGTGRESSRGGGQRQRRRIGRGRSLLSLPRQVGRWLRRRGGSLLGLASANCVRSFISV